MKVLVIGNIHTEALKLLSSQYDLSIISSEQFLSSSSFDCEVVVFRTFTPMFSPELDKMPNLRFAVLCSVGTDNVDAIEMKKRGIELIFVPGTNANSVAEHTLYLILSLLREDVRSPFAELKNKTVGICGFGAIGKLVATKLKGFGCHVLAFDVIPQDPVVVGDLGVVMVSFEDIFSKSDIISIHVPYMKQTEKLVNDSAFRLIKNGAFFVNTSRAEVIDDEALLVHAPRFRGVGVDVYSTMLEEGLRRGTCKNIILTPHIAAQGEESFRAQCIRPIEEFLKKMELV